MSLHDSSLRSNTLQWHHHRRQSKTSYLSYISLSVWPCPNIIRQPTVSASYPPKEFSARGLRQQCLLLNSQPPCMFIFSSLVAHSMPALVLPFPPHFDKSVNYNNDEGGQQVKDDVPAHLPDGSNRAPDKGLEKILTTLVLLLCGVLIILVLLLRRGRLAGLVHPRILCQLDGMQLTHSVVRGVRQHWKAPCLL